MEQTTGLTIDDVKILKAIFPPEQIEFKPRSASDAAAGRGYAFVAENAICDRIAEVDPSWSMGLTSIEYRSDKHVVCVGWMTVKGVTRHDIGEQENDSKSLDAAKGASTDLLKRLARRFGVGQYLTDLKPEDKVNDAASYARRFGFTQLPPQTPPQSNGSTPAPAPDTVPAQEQMTIAQTFKVVKPKNGKPYLMLFAARGAHICNAWSTAPFKEAGYDVSAWGPEGEYVLVHPIEVYWKKGDKYADFVRLGNTIKLRAVS